MNEGILSQWRAVYDQKQEATAPIRAELETLNAGLAEVSAPFDAQLAELEAGIRIYALSAGCGQKADGVEVAYRKGSTRVTYEWRQVDAVRNVLRDILPESAATLDAARKETTGEPSVSVKAL